MTILPHYRVLIAAQQMINYHLGGTLLLDSVIIGTEITALVSAHGLGSKQGDLVGFYPN